MPRQHAAHEGGERVDDDPRDPCVFLGNEMRKHVDAQVAVTAARGNRSDQGNPEHEQLDELVRPDEAEAEKDPQDDLGDRQQHQRAEQYDERRVFERSAPAFEAIRQTGRLGQNYMPLGLAAPSPFRKSSM